MLFLRSYTIKILQNDQEVRGHHHVYIFWYCRYIQPFWWDVWSQEYWILVSMLFLFLYSLLWHLSWMKWDSLSGNSHWLILLFPFFVISPYCFQYWAAAAPKCLCNELYLCICPCLIDDLILVVLLLFIISISCSLLRFLWFTVSTPNTFTLDLKLLILCYVLDLFNVSPCCSSTFSYSRLTPLLPHFLSKVFCCGVFFFFKSRI